jgi:hypothetical protein
MRFLGNQEVPVQSICGWCEAHPISGGLLSKLNALNIGLRVSMLALIIREVCGD